MYASSRIFTGCTGCSLAREETRASDGRPTSDGAAGIPREQSSAGARVRESAASALADFTCERARRRGLKSGKKNGDCRAILFCFFIAPPQDLSLFRLSLFP